MTPEEMRDHIAAKMPPHIMEYRNGVPFWMSPYGWIPCDPLHDLNAMNQAEKALTHEQCLEYHDHLEGIHGREVERDQPIQCPADDFWFHANAHQRAEAFCRVFWPEKFKE